MGPTIACEVGGSYGTCSLTVLVHIFIITCSYIIHGSYSANMHASCILMLVNIMMLADVLKFNSNARSISI